MTLEDAFQKNIVQIDKMKSVTGPFLCGAESFCLTTQTWGITDTISPKSRDLAKINMMKYYSAIGILEQMEKSLKLFRQILPEVFSCELNGETTTAVEVYKANKEFLDNAFKTYDRPEISEFLRHKLARHFANEYELYELGKQLLDKRLKESGRLIEKLKAKSAAEQAAQSGNNHPAMSAKVAQAPAGAVKPKIDKSLFAYHPELKGLKQNKIFFTQIPNIATQPIKNLLTSLISTRDNGWSLKIEEAKPDHIDPTNIDAFLNFNKYFTESIEDKTLYVRNFQYFNFTKMGTPNPYYINIVRDPFEMLISAFNQVKRSGQKSPEKNSNSIIPKNIQEAIISDKKIQNFENLIQEKGVKWIKSPLVRYFCGEKDVCYQTTPGNGDNYATATSINKNAAMSNLRNNYLVVGLYENFEDTLELFEYMLPEIFAASGDSPSSMEILRSEIKEAIANDVKEEDYPKTSMANKVKNVLRFEYEVYNQASKIFNEKLRKVRRAHNNPDEHLITPKEMNPKFRF